MDFFDSKINLILSNWNPINVPHDIAITEYSSYTPEINSLVSDRNVIYEYLKNIITDRIGLEFDEDNVSHKQSIINVAEEICSYREK